MYYVIRFIDSWASGKERGFMSICIKVEQEVEILDEKELLDLMLTSLTKREYISKYSDTTEEALCLFSPLKGKVAQAIYNYCKYNGLSLECDKPVEKKTKKTKKTK